MSYQPLFKLVQMLDENQNAVNVFNEMAEVYQQKYMNVELYEECLGFLLKNLNSFDSIIDIACGPGNVLNYLYQRNNNLNLTGVDLSSEMIKLGKLNVPNVKFEVFDCRNLSKIENKYNAVICNFLIPYLSESDSEKLIAEVSDLLLPGGFFYLGFIKEAQNYSEIVKSSKGHNIRMHYYSVDFIKSVLHNNKFNVEYEKRYLSNNTNQKQSDFIIVASK